MIIMVEKQEKKNNSFNIRMQSTTFFLPVYRILDFFLCIIITDPLWLRLHSFPRIALNLKSTIGLMRKVDNDGTKLNSWVNTNEFLSPSTWPTDSLNVLLTFLCSDRQGFLERCQVRKVWVSSIIVNGGIEKLKSVKCHLCITVVNSD